MTATRRRLLLAVYILAAALVFLYLGFPSQSLRRYAADRLSAALPGLEVAVGDVRPSLPAGVVLRDVRIRRGETAIAAVERLAIQPDLLALLQTRKGYAFSGSAGGGTISGKAEIDSAATPPKTRMSARIEGVLLQQLPELRGPYGSRLNGRLEGSFSMSDSGPLTGTVSVREAVIELAAPLFGQKEFSFRTADADISVQGRNLVLRSIRLRGSELDAEASGTIALGQTPGDGALSLSGRLTPHHGFLARAEAGLPPGLLRRRAAIPFRVSGPLEAPAFSLN
jgi:type II secretion system protein N